MAEAQSVSLLLKNFGEFRLNSILNISYFYSLRSSEARTHTNLDLVFKIPVANVQRRDVLRFDF